MQSKKFFIKTKKNTLKFKNFIEKLYDIVYNICMSKIIGIDAGTTSIRSACYDTKTGKLKIVKQKTVDQYYPHLGWVEEDAEEIYLSTLLCLNDALDYSKLKAKGIGITNMRESVVAWDKITQKPLYRSIIWQCRRTKEYCESLTDEDKKLIKDKTGLVVDAYFSASKIRWLLDNVEAVKKALSENRLMVGTIETYLIYRLTEGKSFVTDVTNASRTMLFNIRTLDYDEELLNLFGIPRSILPEIVDNDATVGSYSYQGEVFPICGVIGDQQSALFGQGCLEEGSGKITYGTGMFILFNTGKKVAHSEKGILSTVAYKAGGEVRYALEGSVFNAGTAIQWLRDKMGIISDAKESELLANSVESSDGVRFVPAFTGLGAPNWKPDATGLLTGITRNTTRAHVVRSALEAMAFSARQLFSIMEEESGITLNKIRADGGAAQNGFLMGFQADELGVAVEVPSCTESTVLGAIKLCIKGLGLVDEGGLLKGKTYLPEKSHDEEYYDWLKAVERCVL